MKGEKALKELFVNKENRRISNIISLFFFAFSFLFVIFVNVLVANTQPSVPIGLYVKAGNKNLKKGDIVVFHLDEKYNKFYNSKNNLQPMKTIQATSDDIVFIKNNQIYVNNESFGEVLPIGVKADSLKIKKDCFFLLSKKKNSFDSRYYGQVCKKDIYYKTKLLYEWKGSIYAR